MTDTNPVKQFRADVISVLPTLGLPNEKAQQRMSSVIMVAVEKDPDLIFADRQSLVSAVRQCASHGLVPDGNEATLQVYNTKIKVNGQDKWIKKVQYQPMVRGIINRVLNSGKVQAFWAEVVYEGEDFKIDISHGDRRPVHEVPNPFHRSGEIVGVYSVAKMTNGTVDCEIMSMADIQSVRSVAKTQKVWEKWLGEKSKVAVLRRHSKRLPLSSEDMDFIMNQPEHDMDARDVTLEPPQRTLIADRVDRQRNRIDTPEPDQDDTIDGTTGEVQQSEQSQQDDGNAEDPSTTEQAGEPDQTGEQSSPKEAPQESGSSDQPEKPHPMAGTEWFAEGKEAYDQGFAMRDTSPHANDPARGAWIAGWDAGAAADRSKA